MDRRIYITRGVLFRAGLYFFHGDEVCLEKHHEMSEFMCGYVGAVMYHVIFFRPAKQEAGGMCVFVHVYASTVT